jgi:hypothetical protein
MDDCAKANSRQTEADLFRLRTGTIEWDVYIPFI